MRNIFRWLLDKRKAIKQNKIDKQRREDDLQLQLKAIQELTATIRTLHAGVEQNELRYKLMLMLLEFGGYNDIKLRSNNEKVH